jgi:hypothetical protein
MDKHRLGRHRRGFADKKTADGVEILVLGTDFVDSKPFAVFVEIVVGLDQRRLILGLRAVKILLLFDRKRKISVMPGSSGYPFFPELPFCQEHIPPCLQRKPFPLFIVSPPRAE